MDTSPKIKLYYTIFGLFEPDEFSAISGLEPSSVWRKGEIKKHRINSFERDDGWVFETTEVKSFSAEDEVCRFLDSIEPQREIITDFINRHHLKAELCIQVFTLDSEGRGDYPSFHFDKGLLTRIISYGLEIDIDIY